MTWTKTPPSEPGFYFIRIQARRIEGATFKRVDIPGKFERAVAERSRHETDPADGSCDDWLITGWDVPTQSEVMVEQGYEFWSERIEEPVDLLEHFQVEVKGYPLDLIPPGVLDEARMHLEERFKIHGKPRPWVSEVVSTGRDPEARLWIVTFTVNDGKLGAAKGAICDPYGAMESAP